MKRILVSLIAASGLALLAAAPAGATNSLCGHSYAILLQGAAPNHINQTGTGDNPGALTAAAGAGTITFGAASGTSCAPITGELIFNEGDIQNNGLYFGPAHCYDGASLLTTGLPCFDGADHFSGSTLTAPGLNGNGSQDLTIHAGYQWFDTAQMTGFVPLSFTLQTNTGGAIVVGASKPIGPATDAPVLTITMQKLNPADCGTVYGTAPYLGNLVVSCSAYGANSSDFVANGQGNGLTGGFGSVIGDVEIFSTGAAGGSISFNSNNNATASGFTGTQPSNNDCAIGVAPGTANPDYSDGGVTASQFADCSSNTVATVGTSGTGSCTDDLTAGAGYTNSAVAWGATDTAAYLTTTGVTSTATGFVPAGTIGTCTTYGQAPAGKLTGALFPAAETNTGPTFPQTKTAAIKMTSTTPADCGVAATLSVVSAPEALCHASLVTTAQIDVPADTILSNPVTFGVNCTCTSKATAETDTYTLGFTPGGGTDGSATACPVSITATTFTCKN